MATHPRKRIGWRTLLLAGIVAVFCFGGSFTCTTGDDDDNFDGAVHVNTRQDAPKQDAPKRHKSE